MHQIAEKIKNARELKGLLQVDLAKLSGVSLDSIKKYESKAQTNITLENLAKIAKVLEVDLNYFSENVPKSNVPKLSLSQKKMSLSLSPNDKNQIQIPVYDEVSASAGFGRVNDEAVSFYASFDKAFLKSYFKLTSFTNLAFVRCEGDSMTPALPTNARLLVQHRTDFKEGQIVLARIDDELFVKRLQKQPSLKLLSTNPSYEPISLQGKDYELLAVVLGFLKCVE